MPKVIPEPRAWPAHRVPLVSQDHKDHRDLWEQLVIPDHRDHKDHRDSTEPLDHKDHRDPQVQQVPQV